MPRDGDRSWLRGSGDPALGGCYGQSSALGRTRFGHLRATFGTESFFLRVRYRDPRFLRFMELTPEQIETIEKLDERNLLAAALRKIKAGKTLTRREISIVRRSRAPQANEETTPGERFMQQARENTKRFAQVRA